MDELEALRDHPVFICGHPKAGTSLLRSLLDSHPELVVYPEESSFFRRYLPAATGKTQEEKLDLADHLLTHIFEWNVSDPPDHQAGFPDRDYSFIPVDVVRAEMRRLLQERWLHDGDVLSAAVLAYGLAMGHVTPETRYWVEKTPYNEYFAEQIFSWWPQARCIHIVRDPRDNYVSYRRKHPDWDVSFFAANWRRSTARGWYNFKRFGADRYLVLRFEDLTGDPQGTVEAIRRFLGIRADETLFQPLRAGRSWGGNSMFGQTFQRISRAPGGRWRELLNAQELAILQLLVGRWMQIYDYALEPTSKTGLTLAQRARIWKLRFNLSIKERMS